MSVCGGWIAGYNIPGYVSPVPAEHYDTASDALLDLCEIQELDPEAFTRLKLMMGRGYAYMLDREGVHYPTTRSTRPHERRRA